jgi:hypothetical protein
MQFKYEVHRERLTAPGVAGTLPITDAREVSDAKSGLQQHAVSKTELHTDISSSCRFNNTALERQKSQFSLRRSDRTTTHSPTHIDVDIGVGGNDNCAIACKEK